MAATSRNALRYLIEVAKATMIVIERDGQYGDASVRDLGVRMRFADIHRKFARLKEQIWEGGVKINKNMSDEDFKSILDDFQDGGNYNYLAIPVFRDEAGRKYKKSEYREAAKIFEDIAATLRNHVGDAVVAISLNENTVEDKKPKKKSKKAQKEASKVAYERTLKLMDGDDIAELAFDAQIKIDGMTPAAAKLLMLSFAKAFNLGKGDKTLIPPKSQMTPKFIVKRIMDDDQLVADVNDQCGLKNRGGFKKLATEFFDFALKEMDIIPGKKVTDVSDMIETAKKDKEIIGGVKTDEEVEAVND